MTLHRATLKGNVDLTPQEQQERILEEQKDVGHQLKRQRIRQRKPDALDDVVQFKTMIKAGRTPDGAQQWVDSQPNSSVALSKLVCAVSALARYLHHQQDDLHEEV